MTRRRVDWVLMGPEPHLGHCERCGGTIAKPTLPAPLSMVTAWMKAAEELHQPCEPKDGET
jgi:hypothetical protein